MDQHQFMNLDCQLNLDSSFGPNTPRSRSSSNSAPPSGSGRNLVMPPGIMSLSMPAHLGSQSHGASPAPGPSGSHPLMPAISGNRIVSRNLNGTFALTSQPSNDSELQLYRVLQRSNLLGYYDTFISQGGDDVQQLCEAGEEEFLEIMALVGMAAKPLHVRRLQKALQEWMQNPAIFQAPLLPALATGPCNALLNRNPSSSQPSTAASTRQNSPGALQVSHSPSPNLQKETSIPSPSLQSMNDGCYGNPGSPLQLTPVLVESQIQRLSDAAEQLVRTLPPFEPKPQNSKKKICKDLECVMSMAEDDSRRMDEIRKYAAIYGRFDCKRKPEKPLTLHEVSVNEAAAQICKHIPALLTRRDELFPLARQVVRDSGYQYSKGQSSTGFPDPGFRPQGMGGKSYLDGNSEDGMGPLKKPKLEYPDSYTDQQHRDKDRQRRQGRLEEIAEELRNLGDKGEEMKGAAVNLRNMHDYGSLHRLHQQMESLQNKQAQLMMEQSDILKIQGRIAKGRHMSNVSENDKLDTDETDSQYSNSSQSSPRFEMSESSREGDPQATSQKESNNKGSQKTNSKIPKMLLQETLMDEGLRVVKEIVANQHKDGSTLAANQLTYYNDLLPYNKIIASSGGSVIAVANPALCMSSALHCNNTTPPPQTPLSGLAPSERGKTSNSMSALVSLSQTVGSGASSSVKQEPVSPSMKQD